MRSHLRWLVRWLFLPVLALSAIANAFADDAHWIEVKSPHFSVVTDAGEKRGRETAMRFEQMRAVFGTLMTKAKVNLPIPLQIVAFRNSKEFRQFAPLWNGKAVQLAGLFQGGEDRSFIMLDMSTENPWSVVFHEYAHQLMNGVLSARVDPWFEEGFAEYFSSIEVDSKEARVGKIPEDEYLVLEQNGMMKVADLFRVQQNSSTYNESGSHRTVFYAESGIVVHYLYDNNLILKLSQYFDLKMSRNVPVESAIQQGLGMSAADFWTQCMAHIYTLFRTQWLPAIRLQSCSLGRHRPVLPSKKQPSATSISTGSSLAKAGQPGCGYRFPTGQVLVQAVAFISSASSLRSTKKIALCSSGGRANAAAGCETCGSSCTASSLKGYTGPSWSRTALSLRIWPRTHARVSFFTSTTLASHVHVASCSNVPSSSSPP